MIAAILLFFAVAAAAVLWISRDATAPTSPPQAITR